MTEGRTNEKFVTSRSSLKAYLDYVVDRVDDGSSSSQTRLGRTDLNGYEKTSC